MHGNSYPPLVKKYGKEKAEAILKLKNFYQNLVIENQIRLRECNETVVENLLAHIHGAWAGVMCGVLKPDRECLITPYAYLRDEHRFHNFKELCWAWDFCYDNEPYPYSITEYAWRMSWDISDVDAWRI